jgi:hypothetical protein
VPKNLRLLSERLPKSNYGSKKSDSLSTGTRESESDQFNSFDYSRKGEEKNVVLHVIQEEDQSRFNKAKEAAE